MDLLTNIFKSFPFISRFGGRFELADPWGFLIPKASASVWILLCGECRIQTDEFSPGQLATAGDIVVLSPASPHIVRGSSGNSIVDVAELIGIAARNRQPVVISNAAVPKVTMLGGIFDCDGVGLHPLSALLPPIIHLKKEQVDRTSLYADLIRVADREIADRAIGNTSMLNRLLEMIFIQAVREWFVNKSLAGVEGEDVHLHPELWPAVGLIHQHPEKSWTVADLAEHASMSRSAFFANFVEAFEKPPAQYMREHRMKVASQLLRDTTLGLKEIASRTGYDSVTAFNTAFKRHIGVAPGFYRRRTVSV